MRTRRAGFTLIELLVAIALIMVLAGLAVLFIPSINDQARAGRGAQELQGWLNIIKQRALRDQAPRGLRLKIRTDIYLSSLRPMVTDCFYIEQPDDFTGGKLFTLTDGATSVAISGGLDLYNGNPGNRDLWDVQDGDYLEINGGGVLHRIVAVTGPATFNIDAGAPIPYKIEPTATYRIIRAPRLLGDEMLQMPASTAIDLQTNADYGNPLPPGATSQFVDILFAPSGKVLAGGNAADTINLWVRDTSDVLITDPSFGEPAIIAVFVRTGMVGSFGVGPPGTPYSLIK